jgi:hypothetical protein
MTGENTDMNICLGNVLSRYAIAAIFARIGGYLQLIERVCTNNGAPLPKLNQPLICQISTGLRAVLLITLCTIILSVPAICLAQACPEGAPGKFVRGVVALAGDRRGIVNAPFNNSQSLFKLAKQCWGGEAIRATYFDEGVRFVCVPFVECTPTIAPQPGPIPPPAPRPPPVPPPPNDNDRLGRPIRAENYYDCIYVLSHRDNRSAALLERCAITDAIARGDVGELQMKLQRHANFDPVNANVPPSNVLWLSIALMQSDQATPNGKSPQSFQSVLTLLQLGADLTRRGVLPYIGGTGPPVFEVMRVFNKNRAGRHSASVSQLRVLTNMFLATDGIADSKWLADISVAQRVAPTGGTMDGYVSLLSAWSGSACEAKTHEERVFWRQQAEALLHAIGRSSIQRGPDVPLAFMAWSGTSPDRTDDCLEAATELIEAGENVNAKDHMGFTALDWASTYRSGVQRVCNDRRTGCVLSLCSNTITNAKFMHQKEIQARRLSIVTFLQSHGAKREVKDRLSFVCVPPLTY